MKICFIAIFCFILVSTAFADVLNRAKRYPHDYRGHGGSRGGFHSREDFSYERSRGGHRGGDFDRRDYNREEFRRGGGFDRRDGDFDRRGGGFDRGFNGGGLGGGFGPQSESSQVIHSRGPLGNSYTSVNRVISNPPLIG